MAVDWVEMKVVASVCYLVVVKVALMGKMKVALMGEELVEELAVLLADMSVG